MRRERETDIHFMFVRPASMRESQTDKNRFHDCQIQNEPSEWIHIKPGGKIETKALED